MDYLLHIAILIGIFSILSLSLNLVVGFTGILSVTQAAFYGLGAYATAIAMTAFGVNFFLAMLIGMAITATISLGIGSVLSRLEGDYFVLGSFGFNIIIYSIFLNLQQLTHGPLGIANIPRPIFAGVNFDNNWLFLALVVVISLCVYLFSQYIARSSFGRVLKAIREDEKAVQMFGYRTSYFKLIIFVIGAVIAAIAGALFASYITYIDPVSFTITESIFVLAISILGGLANNNGAIAGAICFVLLPEALRFVGFPSGIAAQMRQVIYGLALIFLMLYRPQGIIGEYKL